MVSKEYALPAVSCNLPFIQFYRVLTCAHVHTLTLKYMHTAHTNARALLEVHAKHLSLKVGLLINRISGRSKTTIKGGGFGSEGSLASQHMDMAMKKQQKESHYGAPLCVRRATCRLIGHQERDREIE